AIRFTAGQTRDQFIWPARHQAGDPGATLPPMGARFRLKANFDMSKYSAQAKVLLVAMQKYGLILADNGSGWFISDGPDEGVNNTVLHEIDKIAGSGMEAVDTSGTIVDSNSGQAKQN